MLDKLERPAISCTAVKALRVLDTQEVGGSKPPVPTIQLAENKGPGGTPSGAFGISGRLGKHLGNIRRQEACPPDCPIGYGCPPCARGLAVSLDWHYHV